MEIVKITCYTCNEPDGQKFHSAILEYDIPVSERVSKDAYAAEGLKITAVKAEGRKVTLYFDTKDRNAMVLKMPEFKGPGHGPGEDGKNGGPGQGPKEPAGGPTNGPELQAGAIPDPRKQKRPHFPPLERKPVEVRISQTVPVPAADGGEIPTWGPVVSSEAVQPVIDGFAAAPFEGIKYSLFTPKTEPGKKYPLVVFIHDAGICGDSPYLALSQGNGAVSFAEPSWQEKHPCYVLAPQIPVDHVLTDDDFGCDPYVDLIKPLIDRICESNSVDTDRIYVTGQSMGCMTFSELSIRHPDAFAAALLVAGQWDPERMAKACLGCRFWIIVSQGDMKAFPGMNAVVDAMEKAGAQFGYYHFDAKEGREKLEADFAAAAADGHILRYTYFDGSSVVPEGTDANPGSNHMSTWPLVYGIDALKEWMFAQHR